MSRYFNPDKYVDAGSGVLINLLSITVQAELDVAEADLVAARSLELSMMRPTGNFDLSHLRAIHRHLFQDVDGWAGEVRTVNR